MQIPHGLTHRELRTFHHALTRTHERKIHVEVLTLDGDLVAHLTPEIVDGEITVDTTGGHDKPTRILDMTFIDRTRSVQFEPNSPGDAPIHRKRMIRIIDARRVPELEDWIETVVFTGVAWDFDREGALCTLVGHGMERQALGQKWKPVTYQKHTKKTDALKDLLAAAGEPFLGGIPDLGARMPERMTITRMDTIWPRAYRLGASMDRQLFYPGHGRPVLRRIPSRPVFTFTAAHLLSDVLIDRDPDGVFNTFVAVGAKAKGAKKRPYAVETLPAKHPLSPDPETGLGRNGEPLRLVKREENRQVKNNAEAKARAKRMREEGSRVQVTYSFDCLPIPHLDENDLVKVVTDEGTLRLRMEKWTLPLGYDGAPPMTVGDVRRTTAARLGHHRGNR